MPDSLSPIVETSRLSFAQKVALLRRALPSHTIDAGSFRKWAVAVCSAEVKHRERDYLRVERELGVHVDPWEFPNSVEVGQYAHEAHAGAVLLWLSHLQRHEEEKRTPWHHIGGWRQWKPDERKVWLANRRKIWRGFLNAVSAYQNARKEAGL